jgi:hypothetical protein
MSSSSNFTTLSDALKVCTYNNDKMATRAAEEAAVMANPAHQPVFYRGQIVGYSVPDPDEKKDGGCGCSESPAQCIQCQCSECGHCGSSTPPV